MNIYISKNKNIYFNLAFENWLFQKKFRNEKILFLWRNNPSIIIGRSQNPWFECNIKAIKKNNIPILRRQSGGGAVYHDLGNLNYTIISSKSDHNIKNNLKLICNIIKTFGIKSQINKRNDIFVTHNNIKYKISGNSFREKKDKAFHHGTLLINTNIKKLYLYLHQKIDKSMNINGVKSYRSKVINISQIKKNIKIKDIIKIFINNFKKNKLVKLYFINKKLNNKQLINKEIKILKDWRWVFGKTLPFTKTYIKNNNKIKIKVESGIITKIKNINNSINIFNKKIRYNSNYNFKFFKNFLKNNL